MAKFTDYTEKTEPVDTDLALIYDTPAKVNKKFTFGNLWKWIAKKIVSEGISQLDTTNKTIPGAINELNSKKMNNTTNIQNSNDLITDMFSKSFSGEINLFSISSNVTISSGSPDGRGGFAFVYKNKQSDDYGIIVLYSYSTNIFINIKSVEWRGWKMIG